SCFGLVLAARLFGGGRLVLTRGDSLVGVGVEMGWWWWPEVLLWWRLDLAPPMCS
ncbi:hypothetical protein A2U01_0083345, partial [Trifolium medium]|nr:hypothetical protein [Trifolium medium]